MLKQIISSFVAAFVISTAVYAAAPAPTTEQQQFEIEFLTEMIDHHAMAVMMSDLCLDRAVHAELRELCHQMRETQMQEIVQMQTWLEEWYGIYYEPQMSKSSQKRMERLAALSGAEFEIEFMQQMIKHHAVAVKAAEDCQEEAYHQELIELCENIEATQTAEIELMNEWLCEWYDFCKSRGKKR